jgi:eukaryotic-like serine/threonine-protein kinase
MLLDQFRIEEVLGAGGMGTVYRARQLSLDRDVAIKILHADLANHPDAVRRFQREARVATALDHPNVVRVLLLGQLPDGSPYLVMEHVSGRSLGQLLRTEGPLPLHRALHIAAQVADGVGEAHAHGVVHRDVKPENVMVLRRGADPDFVKVLDFGIARLLWDEQTVATQSGLIFGTARYISPEGASGELTDARSDVYSIGVLAYQLIAGATPFDGSTPVTLLLKHVQDAAPDIRERVPCPDPVADVVMKALRKKPNQRFEDGRALSAALREAGVRAKVRVPGPAVASEGLRPVPASAMAPPSSVAPTGPRRRPRMGAGATLLLAFVLGAGAVTAGGLLVGWLIRGDTDPPGSKPAQVADTAAGSDPSEEPEAGVASADGTPEGEASEGGAPARSEVASSDEGAAPAPEPSSPARRTRRSAPPVTTIHPGRSEEWGRPVFAPAVDRTEEEDDEAPEPAADPAPPAADPVEDAPTPEPPADEPPPPWTGTLL